MSDAGHGGGRGGGAPSLSLRHPAVVLTLSVLLVAVSITETHAEAQDEASWRELFQRAIDAGSDRPFRGRLLVITFEPDGPVIGEVTVTQSLDGTVVTADAESWMLGHVDGDNFFGDRETSTIVHLGGVLEGLSLDRLAEKYEVSEVEPTEGPAGDVRVLELRERAAAGADAPRERLHIDADSGLIVRRETYDRQGQPVRLTAFSSLELIATELPEMDGEFTHQSEAPATEVSHRGADILRELGWALPERLPGAFELVDAFAVGEGEDSSLHLFYSDGLYALSVYEQHGRLDGAGLVERGARATTLGAMRAYRWPGEQPATFVWTGDRLTFTAVSDAPHDTLITALAGLPHERPPSLASRLGRGIKRVVSWVWPF